MKSVRPCLLVIFCYFASPEEPPEKKTTRLVIEQANLFIQEVWYQQQLHLGDLTGLLLKRVHQQKDTVWPLGLMFETHRFP